MAVCQSRQLLSAAVIEDRHSPPGHVPQPVSDQADFLCERVKRQAVVEEIIQCEISYITNVQ